MTPEQQRITIAEFCGWKDCHISESWASIIGTLYEVNGNQYARIPNYFSDLNAMHEAEKVLRGQQASDYDMHLWTVLKRDWEKANVPITTIASWHATAAQRAEAFLRTIGKWEDDK
jgi:hypothetical protein